MSNIILFLFSPVHAQKYLRCKASRSEQRSILFGYVSSTATKTTPQLGIFQHELFKPFPCEFHSLKHCLCLVYSLLIFSFRVRIGNNTGASLNVNLTILYNQCPY